VVGQVGVGGVHAVNPVEKAHNNVSERALTHVLLMGGEIVITAYAIEDKPATHNRALVRNYFVLTDSTCVTRAFGAFLCRPRNNNVK